MTNIPRATEAVTDRAKKVLALAAEEAGRLAHPSVGPAHILLGILREGGGLAIAVLHSLSVDPKRLEQRVQAEMAANAAEQAVSASDAPDSASLLRDAVDAASGLRHPYVGTEHLLIALTRPQAGAAAAALAAHGVDTANATTTTARLLGAPAV